ncbi:MAG: DUF86 domain-containing protein [Deinococcota bacterium]
MNATLIQKTKSAQRCLARAREVYHKSQEDFDEDYNAQDVAVLNLIRLCELSIDIANFLIRRDKLGIPDSSANAFELLGQAGVIDRQSVACMHNMVGFRNVAVHQYQELDINIVIRVIEKDSNDVINCLDQIMDRET